MRLSKRPLSPNPLAGPLPPTLAWAMLMLKSLTGSGDVTGSGGMVIRIPNLSWTPAPAPVAPTTSPAAARPAARNTRRKKLD